jgi:UDP:flavonoid glycosyltransferase YjiC (YdhE family)
MIALFPHCGFLSETSRMIAIATALRARGEDVAMATHGGPYTRMLEEAGIPYTLLTPVMDDARARAFVDGVVGIGRPGARLQTPDDVRASVASEVAFLRQCQAQIAVIGFTLTLYLSSRIVGIPLATSHGGSMVPPVFERGLLPAPTQAPIAALDWVPRAALRWVANRSMPRMKDPVHFLNVVADELGVERVPSLAALMLGDLTLVTDVPDVLGISDAELTAWRPHGPGHYRVGTRLRYTGPLYARLQMPVPTAVQAMLDREKPTAYVALNSTNAPFARRVIAGVRAAGLRVIVAGTVHALQDLAAPDVVVHDVLPSHHIMPQVHVAVIMGGQGSVQTAMCSGTPFLGFPLHMEQELNVGLGERHGMAIGMGPRHVTENRVTDAVRRLVENEHFTTSARRVQSLYDGVDGAACAASTITEYLAT